MFKTSAMTFVIVVAGLILSHSSNANEPETLFGRLAEWRYPDAEMRHGATMSDAATIDNSGKRTVPSIQCSTVLVTDDSIAKVLEFYKSKLAFKPGADGDAVEDSREDTGRSVTFHEDSTDRPITIHMIMVNTSRTSTTLVISRGATESETHIAWTQYSRL